MGIFLNLVACLAHRDAAFLELHMDDRHAVDQQHEISPAVAGKGRLGPEDGLLRDLIPALPGGDLLPVVDFQADLPTKMEGIRRIIPLDGDGFAIDKAIEFEGRAQRFDLLQNLLHLAVGEGRVIQPVDATVVLEKDLRPVLEQVLFRWIAQHLRLPALVEEEGDQCIFKI